MTSFSPTDLLSLKPQDQIIVGESEREKMVTLEIISENEDQKSPALHNFLKK